MKIVIDMNLSPQWVDVLMLEGYDCVHWSEIGSPNAPDRGNTDLIPNQFHRWRSIPKAPVKPYHFIQKEKK